MDKNTGKYHIAVCLTLALVTFIVFSPIIHNEFISFDDDEYIYENNHITSGLTLSNVAWAFTNVHANNYHPLTTLSHILDCELFGLNAGAHHLINLIFHIANTILVFLVLSRSTKKFWASAFVAALFALHPLHVESVAWASERKDVLSTFSLMLTLLAYMRYVEKPAAGPYLLALLAFALGLLSKSMLVTLPFILLLLDYWPLNRLNSQFTIRNLLLEKIPFIILSAVFSIVTFMVQWKIGLAKSFSSYPLTWRIENALVSCVVYIEKMFWPTNLAIFYPHTEGHLPLWQIIAAVLALIGITTLAFWQFRRRPYIAAGWFWFLVTLIPVIGIIQVGLHSRADRYTYIPYTGLFIIVTWGICELFAGLRYRKVLFSSAAIVLLLALGVETNFQAKLWQDNITLYKRATEVTRDNWWAHQHLGYALVEKGRIDESIEQFKEALRIDPENAGIQNELAKAYLEKGETDEAIKMYQKFLPPLPEDLNDIDGINPELGERRDIRVIINLYTEANNNLGRALLRRGDIEEAARHFTGVLRLKPNSVTANRNLGDIYLEKGQIDEAVRHYTAVLQVRPDSAIEYKNLGDALLQNGKLQEAVGIYRMLAGFLQNDSDVYNSLGVALAQSGKVDEAIACFTRVVSINPDYAEGYNNLGNAMNLQGKPDEAMKCYARAVTLDPNFSQAHYELARILIAKGRSGEAIAHLEKVTELNPAWVEPLCQLASILVENKNEPFYNPRMAMLLAEQACELTDYKRPEILDILAGAYAAEGKFSQAIETAQKAIDLAQSYGRDDLKNEIQQHLQLYQAGQTGVTP